VGRDQNINKTGEKAGKKKTPREPTSVSKKKIDAITGKEKRDGKIKARGRKGTASEGTTLREKKKKTDS